MSSFRVSRNGSVIGNRSSTNPIDSRVITTLYDWKAGQVAPYHDSSVVVHCIDMVIVSYHISRRELTWKWLVYLVSDPVPESSGCFYVKLRDASGPILILRVQEFHISATVRYSLSLWRIRSPPHQSNRGSFMNTTMYYPGTTFGMRNGIKIVIGNLSRHAMWLLRRTQRYLLMLFYFCIDIF